jgi:O-antigen ligase
MRKLLGFAEHAFAVVAVLIYSGGPLTVIISDGASEGDGRGPVSSDTSLIQLICMLIYAVTCFLLVARWKNVVYLLSKDRWIWALVGMAVLSVLWSAAPPMTITRDVALIGTTLFGIYLATHYSMKQQLQLLGWMFGVAVVLSLLFAVALPKYGVMGGIHAGAWRGIWTHKNGLGAMMILSSIVFFLLANSTKKNRWVLWCGFSVSLFLLLRSTSTTSLLNFANVFAVVVVARIFRWRYDIMIPAILAIATVGGSLYVWFTDNAEILLGSVGKDATLTGRTELWPVVWEMIWKRPWLGYGYGAFWLGEDGESAYVWRAVGWQPPNSHKGFLDVYLQLGLLGGAIFWLGFGINVLKSLVWVRLSRTSETIWPVTFMLFTVLANVAESTLLLQNNLFWVLYVAVAFTLLLPPEEQKKVMD